jgi:two-component system sensor histidine kinase ChvG
MDAIERFAADVSHEIKNPLTSIQSAVETASKINDKTKRDKLFMVILDDVRRMNRLVSDISEASRLDSELNRSEYNIIDIKQLASIFFDISISSERFTSEKLNIIIEDTALQYLVHGNENRLMQVVRNLVDNAETFSPEDKPITIRCKSDQHSVYIIVEDEGGGIPDPKLKTIFDRFYTERPSTERFGTHSGLGLSICKQIVEAHYGNIWAENIYSITKHKTGARLIIALPKAKALKQADIDKSRENLES